MKKIVNILSAFAATLLVTIGAYAQDQRILTDQTQLQNLSTDLNSRTPLTTDQKVAWWESDYGYTGTYTVDKADYMVNYDKNGTYVGTYRKKDWNDPTVSSDFKSFLGASQYKNQEVKGYWEVYDPANPNRKGYYLEVQDKAGKKSSVWVDEKGKFYDKPYENKTKTPSGGQ